MIFIFYAVSSILISWMSRTHWLICLLNLPLSIRWPLRRKIVNTCRPSFESLYQFHSGSQLRPHLTVILPKTVVLLSTSDLRNQMRVHRFLSAFSKVRKATISFVMSVRLSCTSAWNNSAPTGWIFMKIYIWLFFWALSRKFNFQ
jgi:hypothetical protein